MPGVSSSTSWAAGVVRIARSRLRVVWGTGEVIATFSPTNWLSRVDLPTFGRPIRATKPERKPSGALSIMPGPGGIGFCIRSTVTA